MPHVFRPLTLTALLAALPATLATAEEPLEQQLGTRHRFVQPIDSPYPAAGCTDHRTLMFVVSESEGEDPSTARLLVARDCRPLVPDAEYIKCGPGGWAYPAKGERLTYASYCRIGAKDIPLYALDLQMKEIGESASPPQPKTP